MADEPVLNERIVVGVDGSEESFAALAWAIDAASPQTSINAVYGWSPSWEVGAEPNDKEAWDEAYAKIEDKITDWVHSRYPSPHTAADRIILTSVRGSGQAALLTLGANSSQIVVGRRALNAVLRWFLGSTSASLAQSAKVPVTIVKLSGRDEAEILKKYGSSQPIDEGAAQKTDKDIERLEASTILGGLSNLPIVVGTDGSSDSVRALGFAIEAAKRTGRRLHILFCWQMRDLGVIPGYENAIAPIDTAQAYATDILKRSIEEASIPADVDFRSEALHIPAVKGLTEASNYANWVIIGSRGLSGIDARVLGSVSSRLVESSKCTLTVVH